MFKYLKNNDASGKNNIRCVGSIVIDVSGTVLNSHQNTIALGLRT